ncbi:hypothetical protein BASA83_007204 [Batrachochytrium salamandrivorans]|nr:hypothetical protein BASA83_007204 [Batrachochytrium salamandrivorans]
MTAGPVRLRSVIMVAFKARMKATLARSIRSKYPRPRSGHSDKWLFKFEIKDHLVHCESPVSLAAAMNQAIRIDNRIFERNRSSNSTTSIIRRNPLPSQTIHRIHSQQQQHNMFTTPIISNTATFCPNHCNSRPTTSDLYDMDMICLSWPSNFFGEATRFSQGLCLVCATRSKPLKWKATALKFRETISADSNILVSALSSLQKLLLPGTLRLGPLSHVDTFFVDCGADDLLWIPSLQQICKSHLLELSTPIHAAFELMGTPRLL